MLDKGVRSQRQHSVFTRPDSSLQPAAQPLLQPAGTFPSSSFPPMQPFQPLPAQPLPSQPPQTPAQPVPTPPPATQFSSPQPTPGQVLCECICLPAYMVPFRAGPFSNPAYPTLLSRSGFVGEGENERSSAGSEASDELWLRRFPVSAVPTAAAAKRWHAGVLLSCRVPVHLVNSVFRPPCRFRQAHSLSPAAPCLEMPVNCPEATALKKRAGL